MDSQTVKLDTESEDVLELLWESTAWYAKCLHLFHLLRQKHGQTRAMSRLCRYHVLYRRVPTTVAYLRSPNIAKESSIPKSTPITREANVGIIAPKIKPGAPNPQSLTL